MEVLPNPLTQEEQGQIFIAGGFAHPELVADIATVMGAEQGSVEARHHPNGEIYTRLGESIRGRHVFIIQSHVRSELDGEPTSGSDALVQQLFLADAAHASSAREITAVSPYLAYMRQDRRVRGGEFVGTRSVLRLLEDRHVDRMVTVDVHQPAAEGAFDGPWDQLTAYPLLREELAKAASDYPVEQCLVVAPDAGAAKISERHAKELGMDMIVMPKIRDKVDSQKIHREHDIAEVDGRVCLIFDDMIDTAGTLVSAAEALKDSGAEAIFVAATHGIFSGPALDRLRAAPIDAILTTDTVPMGAAQEALGDKLRVISSAPFIGQAILNIFRNESVSQLFKEENFR